MAFRKVASRGGNRRDTRRTSRGAPLAALALAVQVLPSVAQELFPLGTVTVVGKRVAAEPGDGPSTSTVLRAGDLVSYNRGTVADALGPVPGVTIATNSRNEKTLAVRGFDARQVPLFIDGIPVYVPYDGYVDFDRFTTADLAAIQVAKGFSSFVFGPNALGGAINLVTRRPARRFEGDVSAGFGASGQRRAAANLGSSLEDWYVQLGVSDREADGFPLPDDFEPTATEDGGRRNNASYHDRKLSLKLGHAPSRGGEYAIGFNRQAGEKGQPPSTDPAVARFWKWPSWDKESLYFISDTPFGAAGHLEVRLYHDRFDNEVDSYTDDTYTTLRTSGRGSVGTGRSIYHDRSTGGSVSIETTRFFRHALRVVGHFRSDRHLELDANGSRNARLEDALVSIAAEDLVTLAPDWSLSLGAARHELRPERVFSAGNPYTLPGRQAVYDAQAGLFCDCAPAARLHATVSRRSRLPTLKDRYSQRLGTFIENPSLRAERSVNYEVGYRGRPWHDGEVRAAAFYSETTDRIQRVANVIGDRSQMQNVGHVRGVGIELELRGRIGPRLELGGSYTFIDLENLSDPGVRVTDVPRHKLVGQVRWQASGFVQVMALAQFNSRRWASNTIELAGFTTLDLQLELEPARNTSVAFGVSNATDSDHELADGFPAPGRSWYANARYRF